MTTKSFLAALLLLFSSAAHANGTYHFYVGINGGYDITDFYKTLTILNHDNNKIYDKKDDLTGTGEFIEGIVGYQWNFNKFFLATELSGTLSNLKYQAYYVDSTNEEASRGKFTINNNLAFSLLPGYFFNKNIGLYGKIGAAKGYFKYAEYKDNNNQSNVGLSEEKSLYGLMYGIGALFPLQNNLQMRLEYDRILYQTYTNHTFPMPQNQFRTIKLKPTSNQFKIGLIYYFS